MKYSTKEIELIQLEHYPLSKIISLDQLRKLHNDSAIITNSINALNNDELEIVSYYLPEGTCGARSGWCCNGIRFGLDGDYISLPQLPVRLINILTGE